MRRFILLFSVFFFVSMVQAQHDHKNHDHNGHDHGSHQHDHNHGQGQKHQHAGQDKHMHDSKEKAHKHNGQGSNHADHHGHGHHEQTIAVDCGASAHPDVHEGYDPAGTAIHHISDANVYTIMDAIRIPLPAFIYNKDRGFEVFSTGKLHPGHHDNGHHGYKDYVMYHGNIHRITCPGFENKKDYEVEGFAITHSKNDEGKEIEHRFAIVNGKAYAMEQKTIWDGGLLGGGVTSFYDLSPTKNVVSMILISLILFFLLRSVAKAYTARPGQAPSGLQSFFEPVIEFIRDDVAIPFIGKKYERFLPLLLSIFFFILGLNLWGQVPFLGSVNVTGSLTVTMVMAVIVFIITNINGNKHYWGHIFNFPGVPWFVKLILTPVELLGLFIKPLTLMLRLAGNITAGHIAILSFVGLIFIFGKAGESFAGSLTGTALAIPLTIFMMAIELIVAFIQAFVFTLLTASYIGAATEEHHDDHH